VLAIIATECGREEVGIKLGIGMPIEYLGTLKQFYFVNESQVGVTATHTRQERATALMRAAEKESR
jgi:hypothetical protein